VESFATVDSTVQDRRLFVRVQTLGEELTQPFRNFLMPIMKSALLIPTFRI
jgi:hypothetical protein